jgi:hypothetical protein
MSPDDARRLERVSRIIGVSEMGRKLRERERERERERKIFAASRETGLS